jgi:SAM-dependent methyltransferase
MTDPVEPTFPRVPEALIAELAPRALAWSRELCHHITPSGQSCAAYHGIWQYMRLFELVNPPWLDIPFIRSAVAEAAGRGARRALIAGCADYAVPAVMEWAFAQAGVTADLTAIDVCATPLRECDWYAERTGLAVRTLRQDVMNFRPERPFDLITTHYILGLFSPAARRALVACWYELLAPGGIVVSANRIAPDAPEIEGFSPAQAAAFRERFLGEAAARRERLNLAIAQEEFAALAEGFIAQNVLYPVSGDAAMRELFEGAGFRVARIGLRPPPANVPLTGPTQGAGAPVLQVVAMKA